MTLIRSMRIFPREASMLSVTDPDPAHHGAQLQIYRQIGMVIVVIIVTIFNEIFNKINPLLYNETF